MTARDMRPNDAPDSHAVAALAYALTRIEEQQAEIDQLRDEVAKVAGERDLNAGLALRYKAEVERYRVAGRYGRE